MALVTKLKEYRERDNFKQAELAELVGVRRETIVNLEKGKYNPSLKLAIANEKVFPYNHKHRHLILQPYP